MSTDRRKRGPLTVLRLARHRSWVQLASLLVTNSWFTQRVTKGLPCLGLNCYACPLAVTACPIGSIQHFVGLRQLPLYVLGVVALAGALGGRFACGWLCPFGWLQEALYRLPVRKWRVRPRRRAKWWSLAVATVTYAAGGWLVWGLAAQRQWIFALYLIAGFVMYSLLGASREFAVVGTVIVVPLLVLEPWFCKLCPVGTLEGGVPQVLLEANLRELVGVLYWVKLAVLLVFLAWMAVACRPFCRWICPLGALWSPFNRWSTLRIVVDAKLCTRCGRCQGVCPVDIRICEDADTGACVRCMQCIEACPLSCIRVKGL